MKNTIKVERAKKNWTQADLAEMVGVSRQTIISLEKGSYNPSLELAFKISKVLKASIDDLFRMEEDDETI